MVAWPFFVSTDRWLFVKSGDEVGLLVQPLHEETCIGRGSTNKVVKSIRKRRYLRGVLLLEDFSRRHPQVISKRFGWP
jgi:hypothetical protein